MSRSIRLAVSCSLALAALLCLPTSADAQMAITRNTQEVGFLSLPGGTNQGLWAYEDDSGRYCLQTRAGSGLAIVDMNDLSNPTLVGNVPGNFRKVQVWQHYAYATADATPLTIIDLSDPTNPTVVGGVTAGAHTLRVDQTNGRLYLNRSSSMLIYDLAADPIDPPQIGFWAGYAHDSRPDGDIVYVNGFTGAPTRIIRVADPQNPVQIGTLPTGNHSSDLFITPTGDRVLITCDEQTGGHVNLYNVNDPGNPVALSSYQTADTGTSVHNVEVKGMYAYIAYYQDQLRILDLSDVTNPIEVAYWDNNRLNTGSTYSDAWEAIPDHDAIYMGQMYDTNSSVKGVRTIDFFPGFGTGSEGTNMEVPEAWWTDGPATPGNSDFAMRLTNAAPNTTAYLIVGASNTMWGPNPLPLGMNDIGAPNAVLYVSPDFLFPAVTDANGNASLSLPIPSSPFVTYFVQWLVKDNGAPNPGGWAFSNAGVIHIY